MNIITMPFEQALRKIPNAYAWNYRGVYTKKYLKTWFINQKPEVQIKKHKIYLDDYEESNVVLTQAEYYKNTCKLKDIL